MEGEEGRGKETGGIGREGGCANGRRGREGEEGMEVNSKRSNMNSSSNKRKRNSNSNMNSSSNKRKRNSNSNMNSSSNRRKRRCYSVDIEGSE